jgi:vancomycin resistance protein YoaR
VTTSPPTSLVEDLPGSDHPARKRGLLIAGVTVGVLALSYGAMVAATGDGLPRGTHVLGVDVGGQSETQAAATLRRELGPRATASMDAVIGSDHVSVVPADSGLSFDAESTVSGLAGRVWNPVTLLAQFTGGPDVAPVTVVDSAKLAETVTTLAADSDSPATEPTIVVRASKVDLTPGTNGTVLDQKASVDALAAAYLVSTESVALPVVSSEPTVSQDASAQALALAQAAVTAPVTVKVGTVTATIPESTISEALTFAPKDGQLVATLDGAVLRTAIAPSLAGVETAGRDATWNVTSGKPVVVPSKVGRGVNADLLATDVLKVLDKNGTDRAINAQIGTIEPTLTTEEATALGVKEKLSSFTQRFPYAPYRVTNIGQAARSINATLLLPGETFSLNKTLGERTAAHGYTKGYVIGPGGVFKEDLGGGVSTSATATWTAAFYAGLQRVHTQAHSIWISRYRAGLEATVAWGSFDMSFKNDTKHAVYITTIMKNTSITVQMWGTKVYDRVEAISGPRTNSVPFATVYDTTPTCHAQGGEPGFAIDVFRVFIKGGVEVKREKITTKYRPGPNVICGPDPAKASPSPSPSVSGTVAPPVSPSPTKKPSASPTA